MQHQQGQVQQGQSGQVDPGAHAAETRVAAFLRDRQVSTSLVSNVHNGQVATPFRNLTIYVYCPLLLRRVLVWAHPHCSVCAMTLQAAAEEHVQKCSSPAWREVTVEKQNQVYVQ